MTVMSFLVMVGVLLRRESFMSSFFPLERKPNGEEEPDEK
jgi:hypothetical protein